MAQQAVARWDDVDERGEAGVAALVLGNAEVAVKLATGKLVKVRARVGRQVHVGVESVRGAHAVLGRAQGRLFLK